MDTLFPFKCIGCQSEGFWICPKCLSSIHIITEHHCPVCRINSTPDGRTCLSCKRKNSIDGMISSADYSDPVVSKAIHLFKYRFAQDLHKPLGQLAVKALRQTEMPIPDLIIPIALHSRRLRWRGFNQSSLLTDIISKNLIPLSEIPIDEKVLIRKRYTKPQMEIKQRVLREKNISGAFMIQNADLIKNQNVLLVDDVATTGSTIFECAKILKASGAKDVFAIVVARQEHKKE